MQRAQFYKITILPPVHIANSVDHNWSSLSFKHHLRNSLQLLLLKECPANKELRCVKKSPFFSIFFQMTGDNDGSNNTGNVVLSVRNDFALGLKIPLYFNYINISLYVHRRLERGRERKLTLMAFDHLVFCFVLQTCLLVLEASVHNSLKQQKQEMHLIECQICSL